MNKVWLLLFIVLTIATVNVISKPKQYTYYLHIPPGSDNCYLWIIGWYDNTAVEVYELTPEGEQKLLVSTIVNRMEVKIVYEFTPRESDGWFVKVMASARLGVLLDDRASTSTLYPSLNGTFAGKEFIVYGVVYSATGSPGSLIYAYEDAKVTVYDDKGKKILEFDLPQNKCRVLKSIGSPKPWHIVSTGRLLVGTWSENSYAFLVDCRGKFIGKHFAGIAHGGASFPTAIVVIPYEPAVVRVYDAVQGKLIAKREFTEADIAVNNYWYLMFNRTIAIIRIISTGNISVMCGGPQGEAPNSPLGDDFSIIGIPPSVETKIFMSARDFYSYAVLFIKEPANVTIDGFYELKMRSDEYVVLVNNEGLMDNFPTLRKMGRVLCIGPRIHTIVSNKPAILLLYQIGGAWDDWGNYLMAIEDVELDLGPPKPGKGLGEGGGAINYTLYIIIGIVLIAIVFTLLLWCKKCS